jgi:hypothetical protein
MNTTMMQSVLTEPDAYTVPQVTEFMEKIFEDLIKDSSKIAEFQAMVHASYNPLVTIWLL